MNKYQKSILLFFIPFISILIHSLTQSYSKNAIANYNVSILFYLCLIFIPIIQAFLLGNYFTTTFTRNKIVQLIPIIHVILISLIVIFYFTGLNNPKINVFISNNLTIISLWGGCALFSILRSIFRKKSLA